MRLRGIAPRLRTTLLVPAAALALPFSTAALGQLVQQINLVTDDAAFLASQGLPRQQRSIRCSSIPGG
jgi:hypothetical protein